MPTLKQWYNATRPKLMPASMVPVALGVAAVYHDTGEVDWIASIFTLLCAIGIQIITNFVNEIYDFKNGVDKPDRKGPKLSLVHGIITPKQMIWATVLVAVVTFAMGMYLVYISDWWIFLIGILSMYFAYAYTGGPTPLSYLGIADIFVFVFFGVVAVNGTYYVQVGELSNEVFWLSVPIGLFATNILAVNNIRDHDTDKRSQKITLPVRIGLKNAIMLYVVVTALAYFAGAVTVFQMEHWLFTLPFLSLPLAIKLCSDIINKTGPALNKTLFNNALLLMVYGMLQIIALIATVRLII